MGFSINLGAWNSVFAVPCALVDSHIKMAGSVQLKVLLWALRHAGEEFTPQDISAALGTNAADVRDAMQYWVEAGLVAESGPQELSPSGQKREASPAPAPAPAPEKTEPLPEPPHRLPKPDGLFVAERVEQSEEIRFLMQEAQQLLGRPLSPGLSSALLFIHDDYGMPADVILMMLQYVKSRGKDNTSYIEAVARDWAGDGVTTHELAEEKLRLLDEIGKAWGVVEKETGISPRSPSAREEQYADRWILNWKFSPQMVREAYERCVDATGKLSLSYMNRILERWHKEGVSTTRQAAEEQSEKAARKSRKDKPQETTYDIDEYERMSVQAPDTFGKD